MSPQKSPDDDGAGLPTAQASEDSTALTEDLPEDQKRLYPGRLLTNRYLIRTLLGRGGQGEVWRAEDLKLRVEVALKALRLDQSGPAGMERMRDEVRAARDVVSPNVCRIFDLVDIDGRELVSMEYVDGETLADVFKQRAPLELDEATHIATQLLAGLEAVHAAGLVHRDVKPENVMLTRAGRVVLMDLGLARRLDEEVARSVSGTPPYMSPEQRAGGRVDARSDLFSTAVLLAEMVNPRDGDIRAPRETLWRALREDPPRLPTTPWEPPLRRALASNPNARPASARDFARALEETSRRAGSDREQNPYPGLACFTEADAELFFGREAETEALWSRLDAPARLLAVAGPSGAGKSSFLRAGVIPARPQGWKTLVLTPGATPLVRLGQALARELAGDSQIAESLVRFQEPDVALDVVRRWRKGHHEALLVLDQFEEVFTQCDSAERGTFIRLLARLPLEADVHILLGMRDDFLFQCNEYPELSPVFAELTPLRAPSGAALRRALTQPALVCGYRFEDEALVDAMLEEVEGESGALPLLAFAVASLWERRDRHAGLLTRSAYEAIGGVAGALARHAEEVLTQIGPARINLVRELFRNLVTSQGTRVSRRVETLASVGESPAAAREVIDTLLAARLLTTTQSADSSSETSTDPRVEIIHESLLSRWPRLVHWRTQDAEGALMRDQMRQAAQVWEEKGRPEDLLWTGTSYHEFQVWRARYAGRLTAVEEAFTKAMTGLAGRRRRRRRTVAAIVGGGLAATAVTLGLFWRSSEAARSRAEKEVRRAEASKLLALGRLELETNPSASLAYALASLELADDQPARRFAIETLYRAPTAFDLPGDAQMDAVSFSPDGRWLVAGALGGGIDLWARTGGPPRVLSAHTQDVRNLAFNSASTQLISSSIDGTIRVWSVPGGDLLRTIEAGGPSFAWLTHEGARIIAATLKSRPQFGSPAEFELSSWGLDDKSSTVLGRVASTVYPDVDASGSILVSASGAVVQLRPLAALGASPRVLGQQAANISAVAIASDGSQVAAVDENGQVQLWSLASTNDPGPRTLQSWADASGRIARLRFDAKDTRLTATDLHGTVRIWRLDGPPDAEPLVLRRGPVFETHATSIDPTGDWIATTDMRGVAIWPLRGPYPYVLRVPGATKVSGITVAPDGSWIAGATWTGPIQVFPTRPGLSRYRRSVPPEGSLRAIVSPDGRELLTGYKDGVELVPLDGGAPRPLPGFASQVFALAFSRDSKWIAAGGGHIDAREAVLRVWNLDTGVTRLLDPGDSKWIYQMAFLPDGRLLSASGSGVRRWNLEDGSYETLVHGDHAVWFLALSRDGRYMLSTGSDFATMKSDPLRFDDLETGTFRFLPQYGDSTISVAFKPAGDVAITGDAQGPIRAGPASGGEPHLLFGHEGPVWQVTTTPDGHWIVSSGDDGTIRLWPMPNISQPPLQALPHDALVAKLESLTNLRVIKDPKSPTGYSTTAAPFQGWAHAPSW